MFEKNSNKKLEANLKSAPGGDNWGGDRGSLSGEEAVSVTWSGRSRMHVLSPNKGSFQTGISFIFLELECLVLSLLSYLEFLKLSWVWDAKLFCPPSRCDQSSKSEC